jgi:transcriptional regulator GlxA family with amidase domain
MVGAEFELLMPSARFRSADEGCGQCANPVYLQDEGALGEGVSQILNEASFDPFRSFLRQRLMAQITLWVLLAVEEYMESIQEKSVDGGTLHQEDILARALSYMMNHYQNSLAVKDIAKQVGVSSRHLARVFDQCYGGTVHQTLQRIRLDAAYEFLRHQPLSGMKEVSFECGFISSAHFSRLFQKRFGIRPNQMQ